MNTCRTEVFLQGASTVEYDPNVGDTTTDGDPGSLKITIPFYGYNQQADFQHIFAGTPLQFLAGQVLFVHIRLDSGFVSNYVNTPGGFVLAVKSGTGFVYAQSAYTNIGAPNPAGWTEYSINISMPAMSNPGYDPTSIVSMELPLRHGQRSDRHGGCRRSADDGGVPRGHHRIQARAVARGSSHTQRPRGALLRFAG